MKGLRTVTVATFFVVIFLSIGLVSALSSSDVTIQTTLSNSAPKPGDTVIVSFTFQSHVSQELTIYALGIHTDWMQADQLFGPKAGSSGWEAVTVEANGVYITQFLIQIPTTASIGSHTYFAGADGIDSSGTAFSFNSAEATIQVVASSSSPTVNPTSSGSPNDGEPTDWLPWITVVAAAVIVAALVFFFMMKSKKPRKPASEAPSEAPMAPPAEEPEPDEEPASKDFDI
ncbi:MAG: hypothetical protein M1540_01195 [Candidatus Bathyarchaeota archaeon]|nr:hypothetical protein [Candidatus Bathyarchaeota archaeon]